MRNSIEAPFVVTHNRRKDQMQAQLLVDTGETALYRVQVKDTVRLTACSSQRFQREFV